MQAYEKDKDALVRNTTLMVFQENVNARCHLTNGNYSCANAVLMFPSYLLGKNKPDIGYAEKNQILKQFNPKLLDWKLVTAVHVLQLMPFFTLS